MRIYKTIIADRYQRRITEFVVWNQDLHAAFIRFYTGKVVWYRLVKPYSGRSIRNTQLLSIYRSIGLQNQWILTLYYIQ